MLSFVKTTPMNPIICVVRGFAPVMALAAAFTSLNAQVTDYGADAQTTPTSAQLLWLDSAQTQAAPAGTALWFVADTTGAGFAGSNVTTDRIQNIASGTDTIQRFFSDTVSGVLLGNPSGKYKEVNITVPGGYANDNIGLMLWNDANHDSIIGDAGDTFGYYSFGVVPPPSGGAGNAQYNITGNVHADQFSIVPVPEPAQAAVVAGALCAAAALIVRRRA
jgi:hypothetical protein